MAQKEGLIASIREDGSAEVIIQTNDPVCIPCAPDIEVCQCSKGSSSLTVEVLNKAGASAGDLVFLSRKPGALMKAVATLLGIPLLGAAFGIIASVILYRLSAIHITGVVLVAVVCSLFGIIIASVTYRRVSAENQLFITRIIRSGMKKPGFLMDTDPVCKTADLAQTPASFIYQDKT